MKFRHFERKNEIFEILSGKMKFRNFERRNEVFEILSGKMKFRNFELKNALLKNYVHWLAGKFFVGGWRLGKTHWLGFGGWDSRLAVGDWRLEDS
jgi:hypothetical protein